MSQPTPVPDDERPVTEAEPVPGGEALPDEERPVPETGEVPGDRPLPDDERPVPDDDVDIR